MHTVPAWRSEIPDLRCHASAVHDPDVPSSISARATARCLVGVVQLLVGRFGTDEMRRACAALACDATAMTTKLVELPRGATGAVDESILILGSIARGILPLAGVANLRSALSFWASERDAAVMQRVAAGVAA